MQNPCASQEGALLVLIQWCFPKSRIPAVFSELVVLSQLYELWTFPSACPRFLCKEIRISLLCTGSFGSWPSSTHCISLSCFHYWNSRGAECFENIWPADPALYLVLQLSSIVWNIHPWCNTEGEMGTAEEGMTWKWSAKLSGPEGGRRCIRTLCSQNSTGEHFMSPSSTPCSWDTVQVRIPMACSFLGLQFFAFLLSAWFVFDSDSSWMLPLNCINCYGSFEEMAMGVTHIIHELLSLLSSPSLIYCRSWTGNTNEVYPVNAELLPTVNFPHVWPSLGLSLFPENHSTSKFVLQPRIVPSSSACILPFKTSCCCFCICSCSSLACSS